jgi:hypothetical protein
MMLFLGVLSVLQLTLLPGLLLIRLFPGKRSLIQGSAYLFLLSLLANYGAVLLLVTVGLYLRPVVLALFALECAALVWLNRNHLRKVSGGWEKRLKAAAGKEIQSFSTWLKDDFWAAALYFVFGVAALVGLLWVLSMWAANLNTVFQTWDAWASWDRWAVKWAENRFPGDTWEYPQMIPISYSLAYKFIGSTAVKFFGKSIMPLFAFFIGAMLFDLGRKYKSYGYMLGSALAIYSIALFLGVYIPEGYVDIPVACFSLMAIYTLLHARTIRNLAQLKGTLLLGSLATAAAAVTKQPGLYVLAFYPLLAYLWVLRGRRDLGLRDSVVLLGKHLLTVSVIVAPWYVFMQYRILYGGNVSNIDFVISDIYQGQTLSERFASALTSLGPYVLLFAFAILSLVVLDSTFRQIVILLVLPFSLLWAFYLSYEHRNLAVVFPLLSMSVGAAVEAWITRIRAVFAGQPALRRPRYIPLAAALLLLAAGTLVVNDGAILERQLSEQRQIFESELNQELYRYFSRVGGPQPVISSYPLGWLPGLESVWVAETFQRFNVYQRTLATYPEVELMLVPLVGVEPRIFAEIQQSIAEGIYEVIFTHTNYMLVHIPARGLDA